MSGISTEVKARVVSSSSSDKSKAKIGNSLLVLQHKRDLVVIQDTFCSSSEADVAYTSSV